MAPPLTSTPPSSSIMASPLSIPDVISVSMCVCVGKGAPVAPDSNKPSPSSHIADHNDYYLLLLNCLPSQVEAGAKAQRCSENQTAAQTTTNTIHCPQRWRKLETSQFRAGNGA